MIINGTGESFYYSQLIIHREFINSLLLFEMTYNVFYQIIFNSVSTHVFKSKHAFFVLECTFFNQESYFRFSISTNTFGKSQISFTKTINIFC